MTRHVTAARETLLQALSPEVVAALEALVDERVASGAVQAPEPTWMTLREAASCMRVSERTVERMVAQGRIRSTTLGRRRLLHRDDLEAAARED